MLIINASSSSLSNHDDVERQKRLERGIEKTVIMKVILHVTSTIYWAAAGGTEPGRDEPGVDNGGGGISVLRTLVVFFLGLGAGRVASVS
jgi:hypothetical protein